MTKTKKTKLYIPVYTDNGLTQTTLCANNIPELEAIMPDGDTILLHLQAESMKLAGNPDYRPQPMKLMMDKGPFARIIAQIHIKSPQAPCTHIALQTLPGKDCIPCILLFPNK